MQIINEFISAVLTNEAIQKIAMTIGVEFDKRFLHHSTIGYKPTVEEYAIITKNGTIEEGTPIIIKCKSSITSFDMGIQAIKVKMFFNNGDPVYSTNANQHITVSTNGASPVKSNDMLAQFAIGDSGDFRIESMDIEVNANYHIGWN